MIDKESGCFLKQFSVLFRLLPSFLLHLWFYQMHKTSELEYWARKEKERVQYEDAFQASWNWQMARFCRNFLQELTELQVRPVVSRRRSRARLIYFSHESNGCLKLTDSPEVPSLACNPNKMSRILHLHINREARAVRKGVFSWFWNCPWDVLLRCCNHKVDATRIATGSG